jgi:O-antigen/teichoic acid export membrane protein
MTILIEEKQKNILYNKESVTTSKNTDLIQVVDKKKSTEDMTKLIVKGASITFAGMFIRRITNFIFQIILIHILGIAAYGIYTLGHSVMGIISNVSLLGLPNASIRFGAIYHATGDKNRLKGCFLLSLFSALIIAVLMMLLLFLSSDLLAVKFFKKPELTSVLKGFAMVIPFFALLSVSAASLRGLKNMKHSTAISEVFPSVGNLVIVGTAFLFGFRLLGAVYGFVLASALTAGCGLFYLWQTSTTFNSKAKSIFEPGKIFSYSLMLLLVNSSHLLLSQTDRIMLGYSTTAENVGIYNGAALIAMQLPVFLCALDGIFLPVIADLHGRRQIEQLNSLMKTTAKWTFSLTLPCFIIMVLFPDILRLFGDRFVVGWPVMAVLGAAQLVNVSTGSLQSMLIMRGHQKLEFYNSVALASLNIILNIYLIRKYGILGAAIATGISIVLVNLFRLLEVYHCFKMHPYKLSFLNSVFAGFIATGLWLSLNLVISFKGYAWIAGIAIFSSFYLTALYLLGLDEDDKMVFNIFKRKLLAIGNFN